MRRRERRPHSRGGIQHRLIDGIHVGKTIGGWIFRIPKEGASVIDLDTPFRLERRAAGGFILTRTGESWWSPVKTLAEGVAKAKESLR